ncbi:hypothetical protein MO973_19925 [Paenibacillus sp. TRM 82003]|nr:hypothetical protein [Paenibacillus sp. TRM 82003]
MTNNLHPTVYIASYQGSDIFNHDKRGLEIKTEYSGAISKSLELNKLVEFGLSARPKTKTSKLLISDDVINVRFSQKVKHGSIVKDAIVKKLDNLKEPEMRQKETQEKYDERLAKFCEYKAKLETLIGTLDDKIASKDESMNDVSQKDLRTLLCTEGCTVNGVSYRVYKRSAAKSRTGQVLMIRADLCDKMISWSRMGIEFKGAFDMPSLLAYESLVSSGLESLIEIKPKNILIVDDRFSSFKYDANVIKKVNGKLKSVPMVGENKAQFKANLFDGQALMCSSLFTGEYEGKGMLLLRSLHFKACAFNTNLQKWFADNNKTHVVDMFGNVKETKDILLVITPSALKCLKFSKMVSNKEKEIDQQHDMYKLWCEKVEEDRCIFGIVKSEKTSKHNDRQRMSYQMINSMPFSYKDIVELVEYEKEYIESLKNNGAAYIEYLAKTKNTVNSNQMWIDLYNRNPDIIHAPMFKNDRKREISDYASEVKQGHVRVPGDYAVLFGNPVMMLKHVIGEYKDGESEFEGNQISTTLFEYNQDLVCFRNPHTAPSNVLRTYNVHVPDITEYFILTKNIVCINNVRFPTFEVLSGADADSDVMLVSNDKHLLEISSKIYGKFNVCLNDMKPDPRRYELTYANMAAIDNELANSQRNIGETVNLAQWCMSAYWDMMNSKDSNQKVMDELLEKIDILTVLSGIAIDTAKKAYDVNIQEELKQIRKTVGLTMLDDNNKRVMKPKPLFFEFVSESENLVTTKYNCPMDYLYEYVSSISIEKANYKKTKPMMEIVKKKDSQKANRRQMDKIRELVSDEARKIGRAWKEMDEEEIGMMLNEISTDCESYLKKMKITDDTVYDLIKKANGSWKGLGVHLLNSLYKVKKNMFLESFKKRPN